MLVLVYNLLTIFFKFDASGTIDEVYDQVKSYIDQLSSK